MTHQLAMEIALVYMELEGARSWLSNAIGLLRSIHEDFPEAFGDLTDDTRERAFRLMEQYSTPTDFDDTEWRSHLLGILLDCHGDDDAIASRLEGLRPPSIRTREFNRQASA